MNTSALFMVNMSDVLQKCLALIRKMLVNNMFNVVYFIYLKNKNIFFFLEHWDICSF